MFQANLIESYYQENYLVCIQIKLSPGYFTTWGVQFRLLQETNKRLAIIITVPLAIILLLLYSSFGSFKNAILILLNIPLALVGSVMALWISGQNLSVLASVGGISQYLL